MKMAIENVIMRIGAGVVAALLLAGVALAQAPATQPDVDATAAAAAPADNPDRDYVLGPGDTIEAQVLGRSDFTTRTRISQDGTIQLPFLGTVHAANLTSAQLSQQVAKSLQAGGYYEKPIVQISIVAYASRYATVLGSVRNPGLVPIDRPYHLSEILARVGGAVEGAATYVDVRPLNGPEKHWSIKAMATGDAADDPLVLPGDKIYVPKAQSFYISGQVKSPGAYPVEEGMTLRMAIARAGGLTDLGTDHGVKVTDEDGKIRRPNLNDEIHARDVIVIPERLF